ncbi:tyrosine-protein phosphatase [Streptacidiphilus sp. MAP12-33]|uniref:tyrosine-protein phosphatase n=1 Tax=Streptacidiphilus sp. MAP12-33 TaxID=3156266 RepID=UPI0035181D48
MTRDDRPWRPGRERPSASYQAVYKPLLVVDQSYLDAGRSEVTAKYGSFDAYLHQGLGLSDGDLRWLKAELLVG